MTPNGVPKGPYKLVTVNTAPDRAKLLIGRMTEALKDRYEIIHAANCESMLFNCAERERNVLTC